jgi:hypothetical protein
MVNSELTARFFEAFKKLDYRAMNDCCAPGIIYNDPIAGILEGDVVLRYRELICTGSRDMQLSFGPVKELDHEYISCPWSATYYFEPFQRVVRYDATAYMKMSGGLITEHSDGYRLSTWLAKNYGITGYVFGWSGYMKRKIKYHYRRLLREFIEMH